MKDKRLSRRCFIKQGLVAGALGPALMGRVMPASSGSESRGDDNPERHIREARYYEKIGEKKIICKLCPHECRIADLERGTCGVRENRNGTYYTMVYGNPCSVHVDPIEKKPMFHYYPATRAFSIATAGCNFVCRFCQNWEISQKRPEQVKTIDLYPADVIKAARRYDCHTVAHTYTEPVIFFEYMLDCAIQGHKQHVPNVMISNGYIQEKPMRELCQYLGAVKIDLKAFTEKFYREQCSGTLKPVLDCLLVLRDEGIWFEIVVLIIPTLNDSPQEIRQMTRWIVKELGADVPVHFSRYYPTFMLKNIPPTPPGLLDRAWKIARESGVQYAYVGNLLSDASNTYCHSCGKLLIERYGYSTSLKGMKKNTCKYCGEKIPGVF